MYVYTPQVLHNLENALATGDSQVEKLFLDAFGDVVLDPKYLQPDEALSQVTLCLMSWRLPQDFLPQEMTMCVGLQEHSLYIDVLGELSLSIRHRISQALVSVVGSMPVTAVQQSIPLTLHVMHAHR